MPDAIGGREHWWPSVTTDTGERIPLELERPFRFQYGAELDALEVSYESWGNLDAARENTVLVIHPLTTDCHVTGEHAGQPMGWWEGIVGPGRAIDTDRHLVLCPNLLGGCYGTTGPRSRAADGEPFLERFPLTTPRDMMRVTKRFCHALGIERVARVIGPSMGGMIAWEWATDPAPGAPGRETPVAERVTAREVVIVAAPPWASPLQIAWNHVQREALALDEAADAPSGIAEGGPPGKRSRKGYRIARGAGMLSYRSPEGLLEKFGRGWFTPPGRTIGSSGVFNVESWLRHHGTRLARRFDPLTYRVYSRAMDLHDVREGREAGEPAEAASVVGDAWASEGPDRVIGVGISSDCLYPAPEVRAGVGALAAAGREVRYEEITSANGHDAFLLDTDILAHLISRGSAR